MNQWRSDFQLLQDFAKNADQNAFTNLVQRHIDLVFGTAMRKVNDRGFATEIAQNVFAVLARKAWRFASDDSLPAWLHKTALLESKQWLRGEVRRRRREEIAGELGTTMNTAEEQSTLRALVPLLDDALLSLSEKDRAALLLRFYEYRSMREVGTAIGIKEDAAQKRVASALEKIAHFFQRRGFRTATGVLAAAALQQTSSSVSAATALMVAKGAFPAAPLTGGLMLWLVRIGRVSKVQTAAICLVLAVVSIVPPWNELQKLKAQLLEAESRLVTARSDSVASRSETEKLRTTESHLQDDLAQTESQKALLEQAKSRVAEIKRRVREMLTDENYQWPDDLPFVRIPKSSLPQINVGVPIVPPGKIYPFARELMGLSPTERSKLEGALSNYFSEIHQKIESTMYETNIVNRSHFDIPKSAVAVKGFVIPKLDKKTREQPNRLFAEVKSVLGPERARFIDKDDFKSSQVLQSEPAKYDQTFVVFIDDNSAEPVWGYRWRNEQGWTQSSMGMSLASFFWPSSQDEAETPLTVTTSRQQLFQNGCPMPVAERILAWLREQAELRVPKEKRQ